MPLRARFAQIGIEAGKPFQLDKLAAGQKAYLADFSASTNDGTASLPMRIRARAA
jgi:hypothetical protein